MIGVWNSREAQIPHAAAGGHDHVGAQHHVGVQMLAPQIEEAVFQAGFLGVLLIAEHRQRQFLAQNLQIEDLDAQHLHVADESPRSRRWKSFGFTMARRSSRAFTVSRRCGCSWAIR
jgi:hypothetical protein